MSHGGRGKCGMPTVLGLPLSVTLTGVCEGVELASPSIKRNLNICQGTIDDEHCWTISKDHTCNINHRAYLKMIQQCHVKKHIILHDICLHSPNLLLMYLIVDKSLSFVENI